LKKKTRSTVHNQKTNTQRLPRSPKLPNDIGAQGASHNTTMNDYNYEFETKNQGHGQMK